MNAICNETLQWRKVVMEHFSISYGMEERQKRNIFRLWVYNLGTENKGKRLQEERPNETLLPANEQHTHNFLFNLILL